jgi:hypothetical protein
MMLGGRGAGVEHAPPVEAPPVAAHPPHQEAVVAEAERLLRSLGHGIELDDRAEAAVSPDYGMGEPPIDGEQRWDALHGMHRTIVLRRLSDLVHNTIYQDSFLVRQALTPKYRAFENLVNTGRTLPWLRESYDGVWAWCEYLHSRGKTKDLENFVFAAGDGGEPRGGFKTWHLPADDQGLHRITTERIVEA